MNTDFAVTLLKEKEQALRTELVGALETTPDDIVTQMELMAQRGSLTLALETLRATPDSAPKEKKTVDKGKASKRETPQPEAKPEAKPAAEASQADGAPAAMAEDKTASEVGADW